MPLPQVIPFADRTERQEPLTTGFNDPFGERLLTFDPRLLVAVEVLRLKPELSESAKFETAVRDAVEHTRAAEPAVVPVLAVDRRDGALTLASRRVSGRRLSELVARTRGTVMAVEFLRHAVPALAAITGGRRFAHGALTLDRVFANPDKSLTIAGYPLGAGVEALGWPRHRLQYELGLVVPEDTAKFDARIDAIQLGFIALSLWLGRALDPGDFPGKIPELIDEALIVTGAGTPSALKMLDRVERLLQIGERPIGSAQEALAEFAADQISEADARPAPSPRVVKAAVVPQAPAPAPVPAPASPPAPDRARATVTSRRGPSRTWALGALVLIPVIGAGIFLGRNWLFGQPRGRAVASKIVAHETPAARVPVAPAPAAAAVPAAPASTAAPLPLPAPDAASAATTVPSSTPNAAPHFGAMTFVAPIELQIYEGEKHLGSTVGPVAILEGTHSVDLSNTAVGFVAREVVTVKPGELTTRTIRLPNGKLSVNAVPWADVWIDGKSVGQTPLANLPVAVGEHQIVFRHPELGEQQMAAVVKVDGVTRLSATMKR
jgi:hypothetical protein